MSQCTWIKQLMLVRPRAVNKEMSPVLLSQCLNGAAEFNITTAFNQVLSLNNAMSLNKAIPFTRTGVYNKAMSLNMAIDAIKTMSGQLLGTIKQRWKQILGGRNPWILGITRRILGGIDFSSEFLWVYSCFGEPCLVDHWNEPRSLEYIVFCSSHGPMELQKTLYTPRIWAHSGDQPSMVHQNNCILQGIRSKNQVLQGFVGLLQGSKDFDLQGFFGSKNFDFPTNPWNPWNPWSTQCFLTMCRWISLESLE